MAVSVNLHYHIFTQCHSSSPQYKVTTILITFQAYRVTYCGICVLLRPLINVHIIPYISVVLSMFSKNSDGRKVTSMFDKKISFL